MAQPRDPRGDDRSARSGQAGSWLRGIHFSGFSIVTMSLLVLAVVVLAPALHEYLQQRQQISDAQATVNDLRSEIASMNAERARWNDPSYIRAEARERLYYVMPGDTSYLIIDDRPASEKQEHTTAPSTKIESTPSDWSASLFGSFMIAGLTHDTPAQLSHDGQR
jgi:cell division protein FtsB